MDINKIILSYLIKMLVLIIQNVSLNHCYFCYYNIIALQGFFLKAVILSSQFLVIMTLFADP